jgi:hypothetical protein
MALVFIIGLIAILFLMLIPGFRRWFTSGSLSEVAGIFILVGWVLWWITS